MARQAKGIRSGTEFWYTPEVDGNATEPEEDQVKVLIKAPSEADRRQIRLSQRAGVDFSADGDVHADVDLWKAVQWRKTALEKCVKEVRNYNAPGGEAITTGTDLWLHGEDIFVIEVSDLILDATRISEAVRKKSDPQSASMPSKIPALDGTAETVSKPGATSQETVTEDPTPITATQPGSVKYLDGAQNPG